MVVSFLWLTLAFLAASQVSAQPAPAISPSFFAPSSVISPVLLPNPTDPTCKALIAIQQLSTTPPAQQSPTTEPVASSVTSAVDMQVENLNSTDAPAFKVEVDVPLYVLFMNASDADIGPASAGLNGTTRFELATSLTLPAFAVSSVWINTTVTSGNEDVLPRNVFVNGARCAIAVAGFNPAALVPSPDLFSNLRNPGRRLSTF